MVYWSTYDIDVYWRQSWFGVLYFNGSINFFKPRHFRNCYSFDTVCLITQRLRTLLQTASVSEGKCTIDWKRYQANNFKTICLVQHSLKPVFLLCSYAASGGKITVLLQFTFVKIKESTFRIINFWRNTFPNSLRHYLTPDNVICSSVAETRKKATLFTLICWIW